MATKEKRIIRTRDVLKGTMTFQDADNLSDELIADARHPAIYGEAYDSFTTVGKNGALHFLNAKVGDAGAPADKGISACREVYNQLIKGVWASGGSTLSEEVKVMRVWLTADLQEHCGLSNADATKAVVESLRTAHDLATTAIYGEGADLEAYFEVSMESAREEVELRIENAKARVASMEARVAKLKARTKKAA